jgi:hypothetical protein
VGTKIRPKNSTEWAIAIEWAQELKSEIGTVSANNRHHGEEGQRALQEIIPDLEIDGRFLSLNPLHLTIVENPKT